MASKIAGLIDLVCAADVIVSFLPLSPFISIIGGRLFTVWHSAAKD